MRARHRALMALFLLGAVACAGGAPRSDVPASALPGPALTLERFLRAANANDLKTMTELFGTRDQTIAELDGRQQAEERMYVLASLLRHDDWSLQAQRAVPGRRTEATELLVELRQGRRLVNVPFRVVRTESGGWIVEFVDLRPITSAGVR